MLPGVDSSINFGLRPMFRGLLPGDLGSGKHRCFDFIYCNRAVCIGENPIGAAFQGIFHVTAAILLGKGNLRLVVGEFLHGGSLQFSVQACAFIGAVKSGKTAVYAAGTQ